MSSSSHDSRKTTTTNNIDQRNTQDFRRNLRRELHRVEQDLSSNRQNLIDPTSTELIELTMEANERFKKVRHAREGAIDAAIFETLTKYAAEQIMSVQVGMRLDPVLFLNQLGSRFSKSKKKSSSKQKRRRNESSEYEEQQEEEEEENHDVDWSRLGQSAFSCFNRTPTISFMNGPLQKLEVKQTQRKTREKKKDDDEDDKTKETKVDEIGQQTKEDEASKQMFNMLNRVKALKLVKREKGAAATDGATDGADADSQKNNERVSFVDVIIDPNSFTKSIENLFYFSFLVRNGIASLDVSPQDPSMIEVDLKANSQSTRGDSVPKQAVMKLTLDMWNTMRQQLTPDALEASKQIQINAARNKAQQRSAPNGTASNSRSNANKSKDDESSSSSSSSEEDDEPKRKRRR